MVEQYELQDNEYALRIKSDSGNIHSVAVRAIFDEQVNLATLRQLL